MHLLLAPTSVFISRQTLNTLIDHYCGRMAKTEIRGVTPSLIPPDEGDSDGDGPHCCKNNPIIEDLTNDEDEDNNHNEIDNDVMGPGWELYIPWTGIILAVIWIVVTKLWIRAASVYRVLVLIGRRMEKNQTSRSRPLCSKISKHPVCHMKEKNVWKNLLNG